MTVRTQLDTTIVHGATCEYSGADAVSRHLAREVHRELRDCEEYDHVMVGCGGGVTVFVHALTPEIALAIEEIDCEIVGPHGLEISGMVAFEVERAGPGLTL